MSTTGETQVATGRTTVNLPASTMKAGSVELVQVELASPTSPFARVRYTVDGKLQDDGLRLDLDKRAFIDALDDAETNRKLEALVPAVVDTVVARQAFERALADLQELAKMAAGSSVTGTAKDSDRIATAIEDLKVMTRSLSPG